MSTRPNNKEDANRKGKIYGYVRASTRKQQDSPDVQKGQIIAYCKAVGLPRPDQFYIDAATSGGIRMGERVAGRIMMVTIRQGDIIILTKLDRGFRNLRDGLRVIDDLGRRGVGLHVINAGGTAMNIHSAMGRFIFQILTGFAELERAMAKDRTVEAMAHLRASGRKYTKDAPYGFMWVSDTKGHHRKQWRIEANPEERAFMSSMCDMKFDQKMTLREIAKTVNEDGRLNRFGKPYSIMNVWKIINAEIALKLKEKISADNDNSPSEQCVSVSSNDGD